MSEGNFELAKKLAARPYFVMKLRDETTEGRPVYLARALEIENCFGQGDTPEEAEEDLRAALVDFIEGLLEDGLYVPEPARLVKTTGGTSASLTTTTITGSHTYTININEDNSYVLSIHA